MWLFVVFVSVVVMVVVGSVGRIEIDVVDCVLGCLGIIFITIFFNLLRIFVIGFSLRFNGFVIVFVKGGLLVCNWFSEVSVFSVILEFV